MTIPKREEHLVDREMLKSNIHHKTRQSPLKTRNTNTTLSVNWFGHR